MKILYLYRLFWLLDHTRSGKNSLGADPPLSTLKFRVVDKENNLNTKKWKYSAQNGKFLVRQRVWPNEENTGFCTLYPDI